MINPRHTVLAFAAMLSTAALLASAWLVCSWTWQRGLAQGRAELSRTNALVAAKSHAILAQMHDTLRHFRQLSLVSCSAAHIEHMRANTISLRTVDEIGYYRDRKLACSTWGRIPPPVAPPVAVGIGSDGARLLLHARSFSVASPGTRMVGLYEQGHYVFVEPGRFADVPLGPDVQVAVFNALGDPVTGRNRPDWAVAHRVAHGGPAIDDGRLFATGIDGDFRIVSSLPMTHIAAHVRALRWKLLPFCLLGWGTAMTCVVLWLRRRLSLAGELRRAIERRELEVYYQPICELRSGRCVGAEALLRWRHPSGRWIAPDEFVALAERLGIISRITQQVLDIVAREMGDALRADRDLHIGVNLSPQDMRDAGTLAVLERLPAEHGIAGHQIWLEATERGFVDVDAARDTIARWRHSGHLIAIDDFGTGYSSLSQLQSLPLDVLKIDKSFVDKIGADGNSSPVIQHIIDMAGSLGLAIVAEGVETRAQADWLRQQQVRYGQGWLFARPLPAAQFLAYLAQRQGVPGAQIEAFTLTGD